MSAFDTCRATEARSMAILLRFLDDHDGRYVMTNKGALAKFLQDSIGDIIFNDAKLEMWTVECKAEEENKYGNFFLEHWSNKNLENKIDHAQHGSNPGWMIKLRTDFLFYHFLSSDDLYIIPFFRLKRWAFGHSVGAPNIYKYPPEKRQRKYQQSNDTWGYCVPIDVIGEEVGFKHVHPKQIPLPEF
jgi:hypothetical protein